MFHYSTSSLCQTIAVAPSVRQPNTTVTLFHMPVQVTCQRTQNHLSGWHITVPVSCVHRGSAKLSDERSECTFKIVSRGQRHSIKDSHRDSIVLWHGSGSQEELSSIASGNSFTINTVWRTKMGTDHLFITLYSTSTVFFWGTILRLSLQNL